MGCTDWYTTKATTVAELDAAIAQAAAADAAAFIELDLGVEDVPPPLPGAFLNRMYGKTPTDPNVPTFAQAMAAFAGKPQ